MSTVKNKQKQKRKEIIEKLGPMLETTSIDDLSVQELCKAAEISVGSFYHYFNQKDDLKISYILLADEHIAEAVFPKMICDDELENLRIFLLGFTEIIAKNGVERSKTTVGYGAVDYDLDGNMRPTLLKLRDTIESGQKKKQITSEYSVNELAGIIYASFQGVGIEWTRRNGDFDLMDRMRNFCNILLKGLKA